MAVRRTKFAPPALQQSRRATSQDAVLEPIGGLNGERPVQHLRPNETPFSENFMKDGQFARPRSGLSQHSQLDATQPLVVRETTARSGYSAIFASTETIFARIGSEWSAAQGSDPISSSTTGFYDFAESYDAEACRNVLVLTNGQNPPILVHSDSRVSYESVPDANSLLSNANFVESFDDRVVFFDTTTNPSGTSTRERTRVVWSARGNPSQYSTGGGGFEVIASMDGVGTGLVADRDRLILASNRQIWQAIPRRDEFAFDFQMVDGSRGCTLGRTLRATKAGVFWLDPNLQILRLAGGQIRNVADKSAEILKDELRELDLVHAVYVSDDQTYRLRYSDTTGSFPNRELVVHLDTVQARRDLPTEDNATVFVQEYAQEAVDSDVLNERLFSVSSAGTFYRQRSDQTNDDGTDIVAKYRTGVLGAGRKSDPLAHKALTEIWIDAEAEAASSVSIYFTEDFGENFTALGEMTLPSSNSAIHLPVTTPAARNPQIELRASDGQRPKIGRIQLRLLEYTGRHLG